LALVRKGYVVYATVRKEEDAKSLLNEPNLPENKLRPIMMDVRDQVDE